MNTNGNAKAFGDELERRRQKANSPSFDELEVRVWMALGGPDVLPSRPVSRETLRRLHDGRVGPDRVNIETAIGLARVYDCAPADFSEILGARVDVLRDLPGPQSRWDMAAEAA